MESDYFNLRNFFANMNNYLKDDSLSNSELKEINFLRNPFEGFLDKHIETAVF